MENENTQNENNDETTINHKLWVYQRFPLTKIDPGRYEIDHAAAGPLEPIQNVRQAATQTVRPDMVKHFNPLSGTKWRVP